MRRYPITKPLFAAALLPFFALAASLPAQAAVIVITQSKASAGSITPGDARDSLSLSASLAAIGSPAT